MTTHERDQQKLQLDYINQLEQKNTHKKYQLREKDRLITHLLAYIECLQADQEETVSDMIDLNNEIARLQDEVSELKSKLASA